MTPAEFLASDEARAVLDRAALVAGVPVSLHAVQDQVEAGRLWAHGACASCAHVNALQWGPQYCRRSRSQPAAASRSRNRPVPFLCHMEFPCVAVVAIYNEPESPVLTFGPYCPVEAPGSLAGPALERLADVSHAAVGHLPFTLDDVPLVSAAAVFAVAEWTAETLTDRYANCAVDALLDTLETSDEETPVVQKRKQRLPGPVRDPFQAADLLAALVAGDSSRFRSLVSVVLDDGQAPKRVADTAMRGRALAMAGAVLEAAGRAGYDTAAAWTRVEVLPTEINALDQRDAVAAAVRNALRSLRPSDPAAAAGLRDFAPLYRAVSEGLTQGITLESVAAELGENPSTLSKRLQRKLGMSFSEYKGRVRVDHAKNLLRSTALSIEEIARRVGIADPSNFRRLFRQHEGVTPTKYRRRHADGGR